MSIGSVRIRGKRAGSSKGGSSVPRSDSQREDDHPRARTVIAFFQFAGVGQDETRGVEIADACHAEMPFDIDRNGFTVLRTDIDNADFQAPGVIGPSYYPRVEQLLCTAFGAHSVVVLDHIFRKSVGRSVELFPHLAQAATQHGLSSPDCRVDGGETEAGAGALLRRALGKRADALLQHRVMIVTIWRPIDVMARLAVCDAETVAYQDLAATAPKYPEDHDDPVRASLGFSRHHRWFDFPRLRSDEVLVMKDYDSADDGRATRCFRAAIACDPGMGDASIEVRAAVIFPTS